jgi:hypothetical protein
MISVLGLAATIPVSATTSFYNGTAGNTQFNSATVGEVFQTINFSGDSVGASPITDALTGVQFSDINGQSSDLRIVNSCGNDCTTNGGIQVTSGFTLNILVPANYAAFSFDIVTVSTGASVNVSSSTPSSFTGFNTNASPNFIFFGVTTDVQVQGFELTGANNVIEIDNFTVGAAASATPEVRSMFLFGSGLLVIGLLKRRMHAPPAARSGQC